MNLKLIVSAVTPASWIYKVGKLICMHVVIAWRCCHSIEFFSFYRGNLCAVIVSRHTNFINKFSVGASGEGNSETKKNISI